MSKARTIIGAAYWASYLINGDDSGLEPHEVALCDAWQDRELADAESIVSCGDEAYFSWHYDMHTGDCSVRGGDVLEYTVLRP